MMSCSKRLGIGIAQVSLDSSEGIRIDDLIFSNHYPAELVNTASINGVSANQNSSDLMADFLNVVHLASPVQSAFINISREICLMLTIERYCRAVCRISMFSLDSTHWPLTR